jgi:hypothetical protein
MDADLQEIADRVMLSQTAILGVPHGKWLYRLSEMVEGGPFIIHGGLTESGHVYAAREVSKDQFYGRGDYPCAPAYAALVERRQDRLRRILETVRHFEGLDEAAVA